MDCHRTLFTLSHARPSSRNYEQVDIIIATIHVLLVPNKQHNCPNRCEFAPNQPKHPYIEVHAVDIKMRANEYGVFGGNARFHWPSGSEGADITHKLTLFIISDNSAAFASDSAKLILITSAAAMINDGLHATIHRHKETKKKKTINNANRRKI